jgi:hypothetical protein
MFRDPHKRVISSFLDAHYGEIHHTRLKPLLASVGLVSAGAAGWSLSGVERRMMSRIMQPNNTEWLIQAFRSYSQMPELIGCQVKMMTGANCFGNKNVTQRMVDLAVARLSNVSFVGITDFYRASVEKFHAKFLPDSARPVHDMELYNFRKMHKMYRAAREVLLREAYHDPHDQHLYDRALLVFHSYPPLTRAAS